MPYRRTIVTGASEDRLQKLIEERLKPGADKEQVDNRIWDLFGEDWCVMYTDLSGFSRRVEKFGIIHFLQTIYESERLLVPVIEKHDGILLKPEGDSFLVIFRNVTKAIMAAIDMQKVLKKYNSEKPDEEKVLLCIGLGYGRVLRIGDADVFGSEVNAACRLGEDIAGSWEILATEGVKEHAGKISGITFEEAAKVPSGTKKAYKIIYKI